MPDKTPATSARIRDLTQRLEKDPRSRAFLELARALQSVGDVEEAARRCCEGLEIHPGYHSARVFLGKLLLQSGEHGAAIDELSRVVAEAPENLLARRLLAEAQEADGRLSEARSTYEDLVRLHPDDEALASKVKALSAPAPDVAQEAAPPPAGVETLDMAADSAEEVEASAEPLRAPEARIPPAEPPETAAPEAGAGERARPEEMPPPGREPDVPATEWTEPPALEQEGAEAQEGKETGLPGAGPAEEAPIVEDLPQTAAMESPSELPPTTALEAPFAAEGPEEGARAAAPAGAEEPPPAEALREPFRGEEEPPGGMAGPVAGEVPGEEEMLPRTVALAPEDLHGAQPDQERPTRALGPEDLPAPPGPEPLPGDAPAPRESGSGAEAREEDAATPVMGPSALPTPTLAELYERQGMPEKAEEVYGKLLEADPSNEELRGRLSRLRGERVSTGAARRKIRVLEGWLARIRRGANAQSRP